MQTIRNIQINIIIIIKKLIISVTRRLKSEMKTQRYLDIITIDLPISVFIKLSRIDKLKKQQQQYYTHI